MKINCDIGERGIDNATDLALVEVVDICNIACGGHAGNAESALFFRKKAESLGKQITAHLSYPDKDGFGRNVVAMPTRDLLYSLDDQITCLGIGITAVKFHGALYNEAARNYDLADALAHWCSVNGITTLLTLPGCELVRACEATGRVSVMSEAFAERTYTMGARFPELTHRSKSYASIHDLDSAIVHATKIIQDHKVGVVSQENVDGSPIFTDADLVAETICIHSDSPIALQLATALKTLTH